MGEQILNSYNVYIDSSKRSTGTPSYFSVNLSRPFLLTSPHSFFRCTLMSAEIPFCFQQVNTTNNQIFIRFIRQAADVIFSIVLAPGNYNILTLLNVIKTQIIDYLDVEQNFKPTLSFTYNRDTGKATFQIVGEDGIATTIIFKLSLNLFMSKMLGFEQVDITISYNNINASIYAISSKNVNVNPCSYLLLRSDTLVQTQNYESLADIDSLSDILTKIQLRGAVPQSYIYYDGSNANSIILTNKIIDRVALYITDNLTYNLVDLALDWSLHLVFEEILRERFEPDIMPIDINKLEDEKTKLLKDVAKMRNKIENS